MPANRDLFGAEDSLLSVPIKRTLEALHELFSQAPVLGSLINPAKLGADLFHAKYRTVAPLLSKVLEAQDTTDETRERAIAAAGMVKAADLLGGEYTLVRNHVPYLTVSKHEDYLRDFGQRFYPDSRHDLATIFIERSLPFALTTAVVMPQNWLFLPRYKKLRQTFLKDESWHFACRPGPGTFETISGEVVKAALIASLIVRHPATAFSLALMFLKCQRPARKQLP